MNYKYLFWYFMVANVHNLTVAYTCWVSGIFSQVYVGAFSEKHKEKSQKNLFFEHVPLSF